MGPVDDRPRTHQAGMWCGGSGHNSRQNRRAGVAGLNVNVQLHQSFLDNRRGVNSHTLRHVRAEPVGQ